MKLLKKLLRRLYHLIAFLSLFLIFCPNVHANTINVPFNGFITSYENKSGSIACNANNCVVNNVRYYFNQDFTTKWTASSSYTCENNASVSGKFNILGSGEWTITGDWLSDHIKSVFLDTNGTRYACSFSTGNQSSYGLINYSCYAPKLTANFSVGYIFARSSSSGAYGIASEVIVNRNITFDCDNTAASINENNNINTDRIINNNNSNSAQERQKIQENTDAINGLKQQQTDTNNTLKDETAATLDLSDVNLISTTPISDLLTLPLSLLNSYLTAFSGTCTDYTLPLPFNHSVTLPCFTLSDVIGFNVAYIVDMAICLFMAYEIILLFIKIFEDMTSLSDTYTNWVKRGRY